MRDLKGLIDCLWQSSSNVNVCSLHISAPPLLDEDQLFSSQNRAPPPPTTSPRDAQPKTARTNPLVSSPASKPIPSDPRLAPASTTHAFCHGTRRPTTPPSGKALCQPGSAPQNPRMGSMTCPRACLVLSPIPEASYLLSIRRRACIYTCTWHIRLHVARAGEHAHLHSSRANHRPHA